MAEDFLRYELRMRRREQEEMGEEGSPQNPFSCESSKEGDCPQAPLTPAQRRRGREIQEEEEERRTVRKEQGHLPLLGLSPGGALEEEGVVALKAKTLLTISSQGRGS